MHRRILCTVLGIVVCLATNGADPIDPSRFEREVLVPSAEDPLSVEVATDGRLLFVERTGALKLWEPKSRTTVTLGILPTHAAWDTGLLGITLARDFDVTGNFFVLRCPEQKHLTMRVARFTLRDGKLDLTSEKPLLEWAIDSEEPPHTGGGLGWDREGNLLIGSGDNTPPQDFPAFNPAEGKELFDARRSAANSMDFRGKILRVRPQPDGTYTIPEGNLFTDPKQGRLEVYAMGVRNAFRVFGDPKTGWILWGDVGGNVEPSLGLGPEGYDEINLSKAPGFFGWPYASGPNEPWHRFDPITKKPVGEPFDLSHIVNDSRGNTGLRNLPPAQPALLYYPTVASKDWPILGSGGRSITGGPIYHYDPNLKSDVKLPQSLDGCLIVGEWMRNWLLAIHLTPDGKIASLEPFMPGTVFRKPSDLKIGPEGALYIVEYGDRFRENKDGQIVRCVYRSGNRAPVAVLTTSATSGKLPLDVQFSAKNSSDLDHDSLSYRWRFPGGKTAEGSEARYTFAEKGRWSVSVEVSDSKGGASTNQVTIAAGNSAPHVRFESPSDGSFFDNATPITWKITAEDDEDGILPPDKVLVQWERRDRLAEDSQANAHPGFGLMKAGTCFACHNATEKSAGPPYIEVARRYAKDASAGDRLAKKVWRGGMGVWGPVMMPPNPQYNTNQTRQMVDWILGLAARQTQTLPAGLSGVSLPPKGESKDSEGVVLFTATATDRGFSGLPPLRQETTLALRTRKQRAAHFDTASLTTFQHNLDNGLVARVKSGGWIAFQRINLDEVKEIRVLAKNVGSGPLALEIRMDGPTGPILGTAQLRSQESPPQPISYPRESGGGIHTLYFTVEGAEKAPSYVGELVGIEFL